jgi:hypothetical protein
MARVASAGPLAAAGARAGLRVAGHDRDHPILSCPRPGVLGRAELNRDCAEEQKGDRHGCHQDPDRHEESRVDSQRGVAIAGRTADLIGEERRGHPPGRQRRTVSDPGAAPGPANRRPTLSGGESRQQINDRVPTLDDGPDV